MSYKPLSTKDLTAYGIYGFVLGALSLPIYVHFPKYYVDAYGLELLPFAGIFFLLRLLDTFQDPLIGALSDRLVAYTQSRKVLVLGLAPFLIIAFYLLIYPLAFLPIYISMTLSFFLMATFYSMASINYYTYAAEITQDYSSQTKLTSTREFFALIGVILVTILPGIAAGLWETTRIFKTWFWLFAVFSLLFSGLFYLTAPQVVEVSPGQRFHWRDLIRGLGNRHFLELGMVYFLIALSIGLPSVLVLFFIQHVVQAENLTGLFLGSYFTTGLVMLLVWPPIASHWGKKATWIFANIGSVIVFFFAGFLGPGDVTAYMMICIFSGAFIGADLALPTALLADIIEKDRGHKAAYFGVWTMLGKLGLATASLIGLGILGSFETYTTRGTSWTLPFLYAFLPCALRVLCITLMLTFKLDPKFNKG